MVHMENILITLIQNHILDFTFMRQKKRKSKLDNHLKSMRLSQIPMHLMKKQSVPL